MSATKVESITEPIPVWLPTECIYALRTQSLQLFMIFRSGNGVKAVKEIYRVPQKKRQNEYAAFAKFPGGGGWGAYTQTPQEAHAFGAKKYSPFSFKRGWNLWKGGREMKGDQKWQSKQYSDVIIQISVFTKLSFLL